jgi:hypothetical protein
VLLHRRPLRHRHPLEHACPQLEASALVSKVLTFTVQDVLRLRQGLVSRAHGFAHEDVARRVRGGMPQDHLHSLTDGSPQGHGPAERPMKVVLVHHGMAEEPLPRGR